MNQVEKYKKERKPPRKRGAARRGGMELEAVQVQGQERGWQEKRSAEEVSDVEVEWSEEDVVSGALRHGRKEERRRVLGVPYGESVGATLARWEKNPLEKEKEYREIRERLAWVESLGWWSWLVSWLLPMSFWRALRQEVGERWKRSGARRRKRRCRKKKVGEQAAGLCGEGVEFYGTEERGPSEAGGESGEGS